MKKYGFDRLRGAATAAGAIGLGLLGGGGSVRAASTNLPVTTLVSTSVTGTGFTATWTVGQTATFLDDVTTTGGATFKATSSRLGISNGTLFTFTTAASTSYSALYDSGMNLAVGGTLFVNPNGTVDLTGTTVTSDTVTGIAPGVDAQVEYYFVPDRPLVRSLYTLTNTTNAPITTPALVMGDYWADNDITVQATDSGDKVVDDADRWVVTDDNGAASGPVATISTYGTGADVMPVTAMTVGSATPPSNSIDKFGYRYDLTIPANSTRRIMLFSEMTPTVGDATAGAADFESLAAADAAGLLTGLDTQTQSEIVNYRRGTDGSIEIPNVRPGDALLVTVSDADENRDAMVAETLQAKVDNAGTGDSETVTLTETGEDTGVFTYPLNTIEVEEPVSIPDNDFLEVQLNDKLTATYTDALTADGEGDVDVIDTSAVVENIGVGLGSGGGGGCSMTATGPGKVDPSFPALLMGALGSLLVLRSRKRRDSR